MLDILCLVFGIYIIRRGRVPWLNNNEVVGKKAYVVGGLLVAILPVDLLVVGYLLRDEWGPDGGRFDQDPIVMLQILVADVIVLALFVGSALLLVLLNATPTPNKRTPDLDPDETVGYDPDDEYDQLRPPK